MANIVKTVSIPQEIWNPFDEQNPNINFSLWVRNQMKLWLHEPPAPRVEDTIPPTKCERNMPCSRCDVQDCPDRVAEFKSR
jgi:hypothetical protein